MALSPQFLDDLKHRFTLSDVVGRQVKLVRNGREHSGLCPFHSEKSPSFTVNDQKGFYHCFGCGAHGSVIDFVMNTQGMTFPEAIEQLASEVGVDVPKPTREQMERDKQRASSTEVMDAVSSWYQAQLVGQIGKAAHDYIKGRGLRDETIKRFGLGYAPDGRTTLKEAMQARGIKEDQLVETGMLIKPEDGSAGYDRFRDRLMFPITDRQGRMIAFGGRALSKDVKAKYLNSPETVLFHKGATLYNWANARAASYDTGQILVVEGYMDVIALAQAGIDHAVAPLGTALTEEQISHLWQMVDEPTLCFDGDNAGMRAAERAVERALPMLKPGKSLRFILMPEGDDPDTLVQREGKGAIDSLVDSADPLVNMLWNMLLAGTAYDTPERRAGLEKKIFVKLAEITDENVRKLYQSEFKDRLFQLFRPKKQAKAPFVPYAAGKGQARGGRGFAFKPPATGLLSKTSLGRSAGSIAVKDKIEKLIILTLVNHPEILVRHDERIAGIHFTVPELDSIRSALLEKAVSGDHLEREAIEIWLNQKGLLAPVSKMMQDNSLRDDWFAWPEAALSDALTGFEHLMMRYQYIMAKKAYAQAEADFAANMTEENQARFVAAQQVFRALEEKEADKEGYRLESGRFSFS
ncbi:DNA primase [Kordiimonas pumila]|uniref:DNA primase n=1 Tax=Kordiimonas pumila TaxID=2161677 RepID=A0ABV7D3N5_9PROT|nr:DNA primase [Kordiimonas pumila]